MWLIEADVFGIPSAALQAEIRRQGMEVRVVKFFPQTMPPGDIAGSEFLARDACVAFFGGPALMHHIQKHRRWRPGGWCTFENLACSTYFTHFGADLLNRFYTLLPIAEALRQSDALFEVYGRSGRVFVRPSPARKMFNGTVADKDQFQQLLASSRFDPRTLVVIAKPQRIGREWRLFVANSEVITASQYANRGEVELVRGCPEDVLAFARQLLRRVEWRPDPLFAMDVCESNEGVHLLELNGFSCASLYECDIGAVVESARKCASFSW